MNNLLCPRCGLSHIKRNGQTSYGEQNYECKNCGRQFVEDSQRIGEEKKALIKRLLLERLSLRGICRAAEVSLTWLLGFIAEVYAELPDDLNDLNVKVCAARSVVQLLRLEAEADEMWSFVGAKENKRWIWIAIDATTKQVIAFYVGDRLRNSAKQLWKRVPQAFRDHATFATDDWEPLTIVYNYYLTRSDGTTTAERFFGAKPKDLFGWLVDRLDVPARPSVKRSKTGHKGT